MHINIWILFTASTIPQISTPTRIFLSTKQHNFLEFTFTHIHTQTSNYLKYYLFQLVFEWQIIKDETETFTTQNHMHYGIPGVFCCHFYTRSLPFSFLSTSCSRHSQVVYTDDEIGWVFGFVIQFILYMKKSELLILKESTEPLHDCFKSFSVRVRVWFCVKVDF